MGSPDRSRDLITTVQDIATAKPEQLTDGYLNRLRHLLNIRRKHFEELNKEGLKLVDESIFRTYCDCLDIGQVELAREILHDVQPVTNPTQIHIKTKLPDNAPRTTDY